MLKSNHAKTRDRLARMDKVAKEYHKGNTTVKGLEEKLGFKANAIYTYLASLGLPPHNGRTEPNRPVTVKKELEITKVVSDDIKMLKASGLNNTEIGRVWGISPTLVQRVLKNKVRLAKKKGS